MSYPSPYAPPPPPQYSPYGTPNYPAPDPARHARLASVLMWVLGACALLLGTCFGAVALAPVDQLDPQARQGYEELERQLASSTAGSGVTVTLPTVMTALAALVGVPALVMLGLAFLVRRGGIVAVVLAILIDGLFVLLLGINAVSTLVQARGQPQGMVGAAIVAVPLGLSIWLMVALVRAAMVAGDVARAREVARYPQYGHPYGYYPPPPSPR